jgi:hypothetical protein
MLMSTAATAVTTRFPAGQPTADDGAGTANPSLYCQCCDRTVTGTRTAFDAGITISDLCLAIFDFEHPVGADRDTHIATDAFLRIKLQCHDILNIA